ncbi:MAG TPA: tripartite tricarboxylate transporter TctB family protein, partial [Alphaproteobacteria bacterium]
VVGALALVVLGGYVVWEAAHLHFGTLQRPDSGFFPLILAVLLTASAGLVAAVAWQDGAAAAMTRPRGTGRLIAAILGLIVYVFVLDPAGYVLSTSAVMLLFTRGLERLSWRSSILVTLPAVLASYILFRWLGVPLPQGPLPF